MQYGQCAGLYLLSWDHPQKDSLRERIDRTGLYPVTCLTGLAKAEKAGILEQGVVLCREICEDPSVLTKAGIRSERLDRVLKEGTELYTTLITHGRHGN